MLSPFTDGYPDTPQLGGHSLASVTHTPVDLLAASIAAVAAAVGVLSALSPEQLLEVVDTPTIAPRRR